jgi:hypothetical protein
VRRGMRTGQTLFLLRMEPHIPRIRPWKKLLTTKAQTTWLLFTQTLNYILFTQFLTAFLAWCCIAFLSLARRDLNFIFLAKCIYIFFLYHFKSTLWKNNVPVNKDDHVWLMKYSFCWLMEVLSLFLQCRKHIE